MKKLYSRVYGHLEAQICSLKRFWTEKREGVLTVINCVLLVIFTFEIGVFIGSGHQKEPIVITVPEPSMSEDEALSQEVFSFVQKKRIVSQDSSEISQNEEECLYVASINGTKYYPSDCSGAARIKPENTVCFATEAEAKSDGRELSKTCT